jgi:hypothetical protein
MTNCNCKTNCNCNYSGEPCRYEGPDIDCVGISSGDSLETIIRKITDYLCSIPEIESLDEVVCGGDIVVPQGTLLEDSIPLVVSYFCSRNEVIDLNITCGEDTVVPIGTTIENALVLIVQYFCNSLQPVPAPFYFYEEFISDVIITDGAPLPGPGQYHFPVGYEVLEFENLTGVSKNIEVHVSYNVDVPISGIPDNISIENWVDGAIIKTDTFSVDSVEYETLGTLDLEYYLWDNVTNSVISSVSAESVLSSPSGNTVTSVVTNRNLPQNKSFFKVLTLGVGEKVSLKFKTKPGSKGRLLKAQMLVKELL